MVGINTCRLHMLKAKHEDKHFDLMQLLWNSDVWKKFRKVRNNTALCLQRLTRWGGWRPGTPWRCGGTGSTPSFAPLHQLEGVTRTWVSAGRPQQENRIPLSPFLQKRITQTQLKDTSCSAVRFRVHLAVSCAHGEVQFSQKTLP